MADTFYFSRDTKVHVTPNDADGVATSDVYNIPVLDGFSFSQATNTTEVTLNEMATAAGVSRRARQMFTDSYAPAEWSFQTYIRPFASAGGTRGTAGKSSATDGEHHVVEEVLWNALVAQDEPTGTNDGWVYDGTTKATLNAANSNKVTLNTFTMEVEMGSSKTNPTIYKLENCVLNEVSIDFDIDGIATASWSGFASLITESDSAMSTATITEGTGANDTNNFIRNRLTDLTITAADTSTFPGASSNGIYALTLTGGNVTISNNMTYLTPETLGSINQPLGHVTGTRNVSGNFTCYLNTPSSGASSADLFEDLIEATTKITNSFDLKFVVGGTGNIPRVEINIDTAHLEVPTHSIDDIVSLETSFHGLPSSVDGTDEFTIDFVGPDVN
jgi:hypothetical protein